MKITLEVRRLIRGYTDDPEIRRLLILYVGDKDYHQREKHGDNYDLAHQLVSRCSNGLILTNPIDYIIDAHAAYVDMAEEDLAEWEPSPNDPEPPTVMEFDEWFADRRDDFPPKMVHTFLNQAIWQDTRAYFPWLLNWDYPEGCCVYPSVDNIEEFKDFLAVLES